MDTLVDGINNLVRDAAELVVLLEMGGNQLDQNRKAAASVKVLHASYSLSADDPRQPATAPASTG